jgi:hypothetical protein
MWLMRCRSALGATSALAGSGAAVTGVDGAVVAILAVGERPEESSLVPIAASLPVLPGSAASDLSVLAHCRACPAILVIKKPSPSGEGSGRFGLASLALVPASSLPPGAGNEYEYVLNADLYGAKKTEEGYVDNAEVFRRNLHATTIRPNKDGDVAAVPAVEQTQCGSP